MKIISVICLFLALFSVSADVIGIDWGAQFFKITLVKPGKPFEIVENTMAARKTENTVTLLPNDRHFAKGSLMQRVNQPERSFFYMNEFLNREYNKEELDELLSRNLFPFNIQHNEERNTVSFVIPTEEGKTDTYEVEEIIGMLLRYGKTLSEIQAGGGVRDCVITIPPYLTINQRHALLQAAEIAGLNVLSLIHENTAAATLFAIDRTQKNKTNHVIFFNMGAASTKATLAKFYLSNDTDKKVTDTIDILAEAWDDSLGGRDIDLVITRLMAEKFDSLPERKGKESILKNKRVTQRFLKEAEKVKEILSANKFIPVKLENLVDGLHLKMEISRQQVEDAATDIWPRLGKIVEEVLYRGGLEAEDVDAIELIGGGLRFPRIQEELAKSTGKNLSTHMNPDEAMSFGSAFIAANNSLSFKVKKILLNHGVNNPIYINITNISNPDVGKKSVVLFDQGWGFGFKKAIVLANKEDVKCAIYSFDRVTKKETPLYEFEITGMEGAVKNASEKAIIKMNLHFTYTRTGIVELTKSTVTVEEPYNETASADESETNKTLTSEAGLNETDTKDPLSNYDTEEKATETSNEEQNEASKSTEGEKKATSEDEKKAASEEEEATKATDDSAKDSEDKEKADETKKKSKKDDAKAKSKSKKPEKKKDTTKTFNLKSTSKMFSPHILTKEQIEVAKEKLKEFDKRDENKRKTEEAKNAFETLILQTRSWLNEDENAKFVTEAEKDKIIEDLRLDEEWLYEEGSNAKKEEYQKKSKAIKNAFEPIKERFDEYNLRDTAVKESKEMIAGAIAKVEEFAKKKPWLTEEDKNRVLDKAKNLTEWIEVKVTLQKTLSLHEAPAFKAKELATKLSQLGNALKVLNKIPKPKKVEPKAEDLEKETSSKDKEKSKKSDDEPEETISMDETQNEDKPKVEL